MASLNKVMLMGNLTRDPDVRHTPKGTAVGDLGLAINMSYRTQDGQDRDEVCYVDVVVWGRQAETCQQYLRKGAPVFVEGRLQLDQWQTQDGEKKSRLRVRAERVQFLSGGGGGRSGSGGGNYSSSGNQGSSYGQPDNYGAPPAGGGGYSQGDGPPTSSPAGDPDDEIPF
ncbi:MAG: single-stranded DNA-binding protein [Verrucomicrobiota bacterium]